MSRLSHLTHSDDILAWQTLLAKHNCALLGRLYDWQISQLHQSPHTQLTYCRAVLAFALWLDEQGIEKWEQVGRVLVERYLANRLETGLTNKSGKLTLSAIRQFFDWQKKGGLIEQNPTDHYRLKVAPKLPTIADVDVLATLLNQAPPSDKAAYPLWVRDLAMFECLYGCGLRVGELVGLDVGDVDLANGWVQVLGKGSKWRQIPIGSKARNALQTYLPYRTLWQKGDEGALFISERLGKRLTTRTVQLRLKVFAKQAGIDIDLYPHLLRHCFASHLLSSSGDLRGIQELLGHSNLSTTQIYTQVDFGHLASVYDKHHPRALLRIQEQ